MSESIPAGYQAVQQEIRLQFDSMEWRFVGLKQTGWRNSPVLVDLRCFMGIDNYSKQICLRPLFWLFELVLVGAANNDIDWLMCFVVAESSTGSSVHSLETWANCWLFWRNFDRRMGSLCPCGRKNDGFAGLGGTCGDTLLTEFFTVKSSLTNFREMGVDRCDSRCLLDNFETQLMSSRTRVDDWLNWPSSLRLLTSSSNFSRREIKFEWRFITKFILLELTFSIMMPSRSVFSSATLSLILLINRERVRKLFLCSTDDCKRSS